MTLVIFQIPIFYTVYIHAYIVLIGNYQKASHFFQNIKDANLTSVTFSKDIAYMMKQCEASSFELFPGVHALQFFIGDSKILISLLFSGLKLPD